MYRQFITYLKTLKQQIFSPEFIEPVGIDDEYAVVDDVTDRRTDDEEFPSMKI